MIKRKSSIIILIILTILLLSVLSGCDSKDQFLGTWAEDDGRDITEVTFNDDYRFTLTRSYEDYTPAGEYSINGKKLTFVYDEEYGYGTLEFSYTIKGAELTLTDNNGNVNIFIKK